MSDARAGSDRGDRGDRAAPPRLHVEGVVCARGERPLFAPVGFDLHPGESIWLRGANGRGKTTLLRTLAGLSRAEAGRIAWGDPDAAGGRPFLHLGHGNGLKDDLAAGDALAFLLGLDGVDAGEAAVAAALAAFAVGDRRRAPVRTLSQGQRRRVALARLAAPGQPPVWLLDEPFDALDAAGVAALADRLAAHAAGGGSVVLTSHVPFGSRALEPRIVELLPAQESA